MAWGALIGDFVTDRARWLWRFRLGQMAADPSHAQWMVRQAVVGDEGLAVGHAGFHGLPDEGGLELVLEVPVHRIPPAWQ